MQNTAIFGAKIHIHEVRANGATVPGKIKAVVPDTVGGVEKLFALFLAEICHMYQHFMKKKLLNFTVHFSGIFDFGRFVYLGTPCS